MVQKLFLDLLLNQKPREGRWSQGMWQVRAHQVARVRVPTSHPPRPAQHTEVYGELSPANQAIQDATSILAAI